MPFTAHATSPTITMPRVKAITTGSIPSFLDVILNFAESDTTSSLAHQDTWLAQMKAKGNGKLIMYGDDTWLKLFPDTFARADGTSSFFVSDFTEVDNNVTRHIPNELLNNDWNTMIMHYLGLDHIGHKAGPRSPNMIPKQMEMDNIVRRVYQALESQEHLKSTLFVLCGDHGMNDAGNHGGSAAGETSPALVFISPRLGSVSKGFECPIDATGDYQYYTTVEQSDIAPTLAGLLGFPVPLNNLGVFIPSFLPLWPDSGDRVHLLLRNAEQMLRIVDATFLTSLLENKDIPEDCSAALASGDELACKWEAVMQGLGNKDRSLERNHDEILNVITEFARRAQEIMSSTASNYDLSRLTLGMSFAAAAMLFALAACVREFLAFTSTILVLATLALSYGAMMFASSYVEEEQHFWYWSASGWLTYLYIRKRRWIDLALLSALLMGILVALRVSRRWNQTGQKFSGESDIAKSFLPTHNLFLWAIVLVTYLEIMQRLLSRDFWRGSIEVSCVISSMLGLAALRFKAAFTNADAPELFNGFGQMSLKLLPTTELVTQARTVFMGLGILFTYSTILSLWRGRSHKIATADATWIMHDLLTLFLATQSRVTNIPLFLLFEIQYHFLNALNLSLAEITTTSIIFQHLSFFAFGGSNAISSVDLSSAYNGVRGYDVVAVGILTFVSNWSGPIWWTSAANLLLLRKRSCGEPDVLFRHLALSSVFVTVSLLFVMAACTALRAHLFIWTVFSPKYLYSMVWCLAQHLGINILWAGSLFWLGAA
ncbi:MAG: major facilitator super transporter protein [Pycnora praestabilis]|nr:MAG: major facilitator super transporter protein [Pycnora praestabilis]